MHIRIEGTLDHRHDKAHIPHAFTVPAGTTEVRIRLDHRVEGGAPVEPQVSLTVFDPQGARGARHNNRDQSLRLTHVTATPGYVSRPLLPGVWTVWIDTHRIVPPDVITYSLEIGLNSEPSADTPIIYAKGATAPRGAGWYRGDLHGHTLHSDGSWDVRDFVRYARDYRLDFVTLTDHNTVSPLAEHDSYSANDLLTMGGIELTTYHGHALALGVRDWLEWRTTLDNLGMPEAARRALDAGALYIIAHPMSVGDPWCTGCDWQYPDMMPGSARCVEVWNGPWGDMSNNERSLALWYGWLNEGCRMVATAGTDIHGPLNDPYPGFNVVYADELSEQAILDAIRRGHLYLSSAPRLEFVATSTGGARAMMGDLIERALLDLLVTWSDVEQGSRIRLIQDGAVIEEMPIDAEGSLNRTRDGGRWYTVEIRAADGELRAVANPIFTGAADDWS